jgi:acetyl-CoA acetyltransferase
VIDGINRVSPEFLIDALQLDVSWYESTSYGTLYRAFIEAVNAVASGNCATALVFRSLHNPRGRYGVTAPTEAGGIAQFVAPYGVFPPGIFAQVWNRYMWKYGTTREQMAPFIVNNRNNGLLWEHGYWSQHRPVGLTIDDYLDAPMISAPIGLYDCDIPVQAVGAFVLTSADRARHLPHPPAYVRGWALPDILRGWGYYSTLEVMQERATRFARRLLASAEIEAHEVDVVNVYDGFSVLVPLWLEAFGFCGEGEGLDFMVPENIAIDSGNLPLNTSGGNLGAGRMHGVPQVMDSVLQIMGRSGKRQVPGADIALCTVGAQPGMGGGMVFSSSLT